ncbi:hypothetical protein SAMN05920897_10378 [Alkalispirochaeta americana]|uniref:Fibronectin type-III domain-containing protein n=1 Tax=Alkalispirochaeta americana TaxID=159291 RepID=A0A1N6PQ17_9SPIO|nr:fibronectin type III domain-containing protein [Alkalispirochaeta americana]SIQ06289.1 hypothetical protein SAMN05920897_10378 [Alkalispirochaeta americana]
MVSWYKNVKVYVLCSLVCVAACSAVLSPFEKSDNDRSPALRGGTGATGTLIITFPVGAATVLPPEASPEDLRFDLTLTPDDPDQEELEALDLSVSEISLPGIPPGTWNISLRGYFPDDTEVETFGASGEVNIIAGQIVTWTADLQAARTEDGEGSVEIELSWDPPGLITGYHNDAGVPTPSLQRLRPGQTPDEPIHIPTANIDFDSGAGTLRYHQTGPDSLLESGFYRIVIPLQRNGIPVATYRDIIHIYDGRRSEKTLDITGRIGLPPSAPEDLQATQGAFDPDEGWAVHLSWTRTANTALGYRIYRKEAGADEFATALPGAGSLPSNSSLYTDRVPPDSSWHYRVVAYNTYGESQGAETPEPFEAGGVFTVTYLGGDGSSGAPPGPVYLMADADPHEILQPQALRGPGLTGHEGSGITQRFLGWLEGDDEYQPGDSLTITGDITLTAQWTNDNEVIGKIGPAGGLVFFDTDDDSDPMHESNRTSNLVGWRYLEISLEQIAPLPWLRSGIETGDLENLEYMEEIGQASGLGRHNTTAVIAAQGGTGDYAALEARNYAGGGFSDWFLPSEEELAILDAKIFQNEDLRNRAGIQDSSWFWHSNLRHDGAAARYFYTGSGFITDPPLTDLLPSRVIRGFAGPEETYIVFYDPGLADENWGMSLYTSTNHPPRFHSQGEPVTIPHVVPLPDSSSFLGWQEVGTDSPMALIEWDGEGDPPTFTMPGRDVFLQGQWVANLVISSETLDTIFGTGTIVYYDLIDADGYAHQGSGWGSGQTSEDFDGWYGDGNVQLLQKDGETLQAKEGDRPQFEPGALTGLAPGKEWRILLTSWSEREETTSYGDAALSDPFMLSEGAPLILNTSDFVDTWWISD